MKSYLRKLPGGLFRLDDQDGSDRVAKLAPGSVVAIEWHEPRNYGFHKKFFAMLKAGFDAWEPPEAEYRGLPVEKNFDRFRRDCIIAAGWYDTVVNIKGEVRAEAKSMSFAAMSEDEFRQLYDAVAELLLKHILVNYTRADLDQVVETMQGFL
jgi:hypothetical protein